VAQWVYLLRDPVVLCSCFDPDELISIVLGCGFCPDPMNSHHSHIVHLQAMELDLVEARAAHPDLMVLMMIGVHVHVYVGVGAVPRLFDTSQVPFLQRECAQPRHDEKL